MQRRFVLAAVAGLALTLPFATPFAHAQQPGERALRLSTTTSTENSGLLTYLLPSFEAKHGIKVNVISVGTGKALELGRNGDVDLTLVHARQLEDKFVLDGWGVDRRDVMYNDFIVVGPSADPARVKGDRNVISAFRKIAGANVRFISRGDNSGTDVMEKGYWQQAGAKPSGSNYVSAGLGMGEVLNMAAEMNAYTLTDRATYGAYKARTGLAIVVEGDRRMFNPYGIIAVNPDRHKGVNYRGAKLLIDWITSPEAQAKIAAFRPAGEQLFFPSAQR
ncbi:substrate-binding domain-containing protein [Massilia sp. MS-15]|uniref:substrate-binding domain-containing protein n=1 Tax=Massilia sp. MS-15 TaxID=2878200 RepID=UPI001CD565CE|nr:substrate-binding domain-containing protein [Massilia sp. MS-15]MCA1245324.1 substrate-binding domain-containing protein [Massilia sp. MS-15]